MMFLLTALKIFYILVLNLPEILASTVEDNDQLKTDNKKQNEDELLYRGFILNILSNHLNDLFIFIKSSKEI
jgi:hypothetical protein